MIVSYGTAQEIAWRTLTLSNGGTFEFMPRKTTKRLGWRTTVMFGSLSSDWMSSVGNS